MKIQINVTVNFMNEEQVVDGIAEFESKTFEVPSFVIEKSGFEIKYHGRDFKIKDPVFNVDEGVLIISKGVLYELGPGQSVDHCFEEIQSHTYTKDHWNSTDFHILA